MRASRKTCPICDIEVSDHANLCRSCYHTSIKTINTCDECLKELPSPKAKLCRECWMKNHMAHTSRPKCDVCGKLISWQVGRKGNPAKKCRECYAQFRRDNRIVTLFSAVTPEEASTASRKRRLARHMAGPIRNVVGPMPCALCGDGEAGVSRRIHRIEPFLGYVMGNVAPVCGSCHDKIHAGIRQQPNPITEEEVRTYYSLT